jgi:hypothetical protein
MQFGLPHKDGRRSWFILVSLVLQQHRVASRAATAPDVSDGCESQSPTLVRMKAKIGEAV